MISRRKALFGALFAPTIIRTPGLLMAIRAVETSREDFLAIMACQAELLAFRKEAVGKLSNRDTFPIYKGYGEIGAPVGYGLRRYFELASLA